MKRNLLFAIMLLCFVGICQAQSIVWVSDCVTEDEPHDQGFIDLLESQGYSVSRLAEPRVITEERVQEMNDADLVIVGRHGDSGFYVDGANEKEMWNSITTPIINQNPYLARNSRWKWFNANGISEGNDSLSASNNQDSVYQFVNINDTNSVSIAAFGAIAFVSIIDQGNGALVARRNNVTMPYVWIVRWEAGQEYYAGSGQTAGGPRVYFPSSESGGTGDGNLNLTSEGTMMFLNLVYELSGASFNRAPLVSAGRDKVTTINTELQLNADIVDDGLPLPISETVSWSKASGPGNVSFSDTDILNPVVSFDAVGTYELEIVGSDGKKNATDIIVVTVVDSADNKLISKWSFDSMASTPATPVADENSDNNGMFVGAIDDPLTETYVEEPNIIDGWIGANALDMVGDSWVEITPASSDPNAFNLQTGVSISSWIKVNGNTLGNLNTIVAKGDTSWRISATNTSNEGGIHFNCNGTTARIDSVRRDLADGYWHHVAAVYDSVSERAALYIDGVLDTEMEAFGLIDVVDAPVWIGNNSEQTARVWNGAIDDVRVYNYGISTEEVETLAAMAPKVTFVNVGDDIEYKRNAEGLSISAIVIDDELPQTALLAWSVVSKPEGVSDPVFSPIDSAETNIMFSAQGQYELALTANDTVAEISDSLVITVIDPTCQDVIDAGLLLAGDVIRIAILI